MNQFQVGFLVVGLKCNLQITEALMSRKDY